MGFAWGGMGGMRARGYGQRMVLRKWCLAPTHKGGELTVVHLQKLFVDMEALVRWTRGVRTWVGGGGGKADLQMTREAGTCDKVRERRASTTA